MIPSTVLTRQHHRYVKSLVKNFISKTQLNNFKSLYFFQAKPGEKQSKPFDADKSFGVSIALYVINFIFFTLLFCLLFLLKEFSFADSDAGAFDADTLGGNFEAADFAEGFGFDDD